MRTSGFMVTFQGTVMGKMAGEVGAKLVEGGCLQPLLEQALRFAGTLQQGLVDQLLDRAAAPAFAGTDLDHRRRADGLVDVVQGDRRRIAGELAAATVAARAAYQAGLVHLR